MQNDKFGYLRTFSSTSTVERARLRSKLEFWTLWASKGCPFRKLLGVLWGPLRLPLPSACQGKGYFGTFWECLNSLSSLPVKEKAISGSGQEASERSFSEDPGHQLWPLAIAFSRCLSTKRLFQSSLGMLAMAFPTCLSRKR